ncbi:UNVERIFIED_CONTAM: hypothetical protein PYX00_003153 [Menopon gallinae]|uniref:Uncharacterized protein n=1 Tax=Menopon gallinae TaxID=328185 RepID=A0AAW2I0S0_9NEOP
MEKRQVGVLARSGALPQGKRSVEALARNGELPVPSSEKRGNAEEYVLDQLIRELGTAEGLSRMRVQALAEKLQSEEYEDAVGKRSVASLARNSELPQKRVVTHRSGYLIRPLHETEETDLLDPDDFLGKGGVDMLAVNGGFNVADGSLASFAKHGYGDEFGYDEYDDETDAIDKRHVGAARNFLFGGSSKRNLASLKNFLSSAGKRTVVNFGKRNVGAARNFLLSDKRNVGAFKNFLSTEKRNLGAARNFLLDEGKRNLGAARDFLYGKRNLASFARDGGFSSLRYPSMKDYDWDDVFDFDDFHEEEDKRNLGASRNFGKRSAPEKATSETPEKGKARTKRDAYLDAQTDEYPMPVLQASGELDYGDVEPLSNDLQKRFLGRIPQLGHVRQKTQTPSGRRRHQLRPKWL